MKPFRILPVTYGAGLAVLVTGLASLEEVAATTSAPGDVRAPVLLDALEVDYHDAHQGGRVVALVRAELWSAGPAEVRLTVRPSAIGRAVEPLAGLEGRRGGNRRTALELDRLARGEERLRFELRRVGADESRTGDVFPGTRGHLPVRRLTPEGALDLDATEPVERLLELVLDSGPLAPGRWEGEVRVGGRVRLIVELDFDGARGAILSLRGDGHPGDLR